MLLFQQADHEVQIKQRIYSNYQMLKQADVVRQAFEKKNVREYFSVIMLPSKSLTSQTILKQEAGTANYNWNF